MNKLTPPKGHQSWLDYAVSTMDARSAYVDVLIEGKELTSQDDIRAVARNELEALRSKAAMPWIAMLERWSQKLSQRLGRSEEEIRRDSLLATDFSRAGVRLVFEDGTDLVFKRAFHVSPTLAEVGGSVSGTYRVAVFTEHCGYHEFWLGSNDRIEAFNDGDAFDEDRDWDSMAPVGREFGSPDFDRLMEEDAALFKLDLLAWIETSKREVPASEIRFAMKNFRTEIDNIEKAFLSFNLDRSVTAEVAAAVWIHYSHSIAAGWLAGADSARSAAKTLCLNCPRITNSK